MNTWIGVDLGGTHLRAALADDRGNILAAVKTGTHAYEGAQAVTGRVARAVRMLPGWEDALGIGIGIPGGVSKDGETTVLATNLTGFDGFPVRSHLSGLTGKPVVLENDANAACLAEALLGAGQGMQTVVYMTISTGIGGGIYINGKLIRGARGCAAEFGSISVDPERGAVGDLPPGAVESEASGESLVKKAHAALGRPFSHAGEVYDLAACGDPGAVELADRAAKDLAVALSNIACVLDPDIFILGGGCLKSADILLPKLTACYRAFAQPVFREIPIRKGTLEEPGLIGAAILAREAFQGRPDV